MPDRIQREVEELLERLEHFPPKRPLRQRVVETVASPFRSLGRAFSRLRLPNVSAGHILLFAIVAVVVAYVAGDGTEWGRWVIVGGILLFVAAFVMSLRRQSRPPEKLWRGKPLDEVRSGRGRSWWDRWRTRR